MRSPQFCRPEAYELFRSQLPGLRSTDALLRAAVAISMHELEDVSPDDVQRELEGHAATVRRRVRSDEARAYLAHLHAHLFDEIGFRGCTESYYDPRNSYVPEVLRTRRGLPITLCLVYKYVAEKVGLKAEGINSPAHFLASVHDGKTTLLVDPFARGRVLTREEAFRRMEQAADADVPRSESAFAQASHPRWLVRMLANLKSVFTQLGRTNDLRAMIELQELLRPTAG